VNNPLQNTIILLLEQIVGALGTDFKLYLPHIVPHILRVFLHDTTPGRTATAKVSHCSSENNYCQFGSFQLQNLCFTQSCNKNMMRSSYVETFQFSAGQRTVRVSVMSS